MVEYHSAGWYYRNIGNGINFLAYRFKGEFVMGFKYETHMHTSEVSGCAISTAAEQVHAYINRGYTGIIITDHFFNGNSTCPLRLPWSEKIRHFISGYEAAKREGDLYGLDVFFGWEFTYRGSDFLTYGLDTEFLLSNPDIDKLNAEDYSALVRKNGGFLAQAHPYRNEWYIEYRLPVAPHLLDCVEVYNASMSKDTNAKALAFAKSHDLYMQAGSDSHYENLPFASGVELSYRAKSIFDIIEGIKTKKAALILP
jgi:hypothetical protein